MAKVIKPSQPSPTANQSTAEQPKLSRWEKFKQVLGSSWDKISPILASSRDKISQILASSPSTWDEFSSRFPASISRPHSALPPQLIPDKDTKNEDLDQALREILDRPTPQARKRVTQVIADNGSEVKKPGGFEHFKKIIETDLRMNHATYSMGMVYALLRNSLVSARGESIAERMGMDLDNLYHLLQAVFTEVQRQQVERDEIVTLLQPGHTSKEILYSEILGLKDDSAPEEIRAKCEEFKRTIGSYKELLVFPYVALVNEVIGLVKNNKDPKVTTTDILEKKHLLSDKPRLFDVKRIEDVLSGKAEQATSTPPLKPKAGPKAAAATAAKTPAVITPKKTTIDFDALYNEIQEDPALSAAYPPFYHLFYALRRSEADYNAKQRNQFFGGEERDIVMSDIDTATGDGMSVILWEAATKATNEEYLTALIKAVAEHEGLTQKPDQLKARILEIGSALGRLYPKLKSYN